MARPSLTTERLWVRPVREEDAGELHVAYADADALQWWHRSPSVTIADTDEAVRALVHVDAAQFAIGVHGDGTVLGHVGFVNGLEADGHAGFGYLLRRAVWGRGYVTEASRAVLGWGFDVVGVARAELWFHRDNWRSIHVARALGAIRRGETTVGAIYGLTAEQWRGEPDPAPLHLGAEPILRVTDVAAAVRWWVDVLGFRAGFTWGDPPTHAGVLADPGWSGLHRVQLTQRPAEEAGGSTVYVPVGSGLLDALAERAVVAGATVVEPLGDRPWGRESALADPDGNRIRLG
jgi:RimJ/RimL family protein N-acetyltransferase/catechol 2,3-dioxygenase-like lactoylglutathione lyase family enzyme